MMIIMRIMVTIASSTEAVSIAEVLRDWLKSERLTVPLDTQRVFEAWDNASGAGRYTMKRFYRDGKLYITLSSSVIRSQLSFQKDALLEKINSLLSDDPLFVLVNSYTTGLQPAVLTYLLHTAVGKRHKGTVESSEIGLPVTGNGLVLPCGASGRWFSQTR